MGDGWAMKDEGCGAFFGWIDRQNFILFYTIKWIRWIYTNQAGENIILYHISGLLIRRYKREKKKKEIEKSKNLERTYLLPSFFPLCVDISTKRTGRRRKRRRSRERGKETRLLSTSILSIYLSTFCYSAYLTAPSASSTLKSFLPQVARLSHSV